MNGRFALLLFSGFVRSKFCHLALEIRTLGIRLRTDGHVLACRHRHGTRHQARNAGDQHLAAPGTRRRDADDQTCG